MLVQDAKGNDVDLSVYKGKVLLIVNVASKWYLPWMFSFLHFFFAVRNKKEVIFFSLLFTPDLLQWTDKRKLHGVESTV